MYGRNSLQCRSCRNEERKVAHTPQQYRREWHMRKKYGLSPEEFDAWWVVCRGKCMICRQNMRLPTLTRGQALDVVAIDHDHATNEFRGLLCNGCNKGIGLFRENVVALRQAVTYLGANDNTRTT